MRPLTSSVEHDREQLRAKRAIDCNNAFVVPHGVAFLRRETGDDLAIVLDAATAAAHQHGSGLDSYFGLVVEQPPDDAFQPECGVDQFVVSDAAAERGDFMIIPTGPERLRWRMKRWFPNLYFRELMKFTLKMQLRSAEKTAGRA